MFRIEAVIGELPYTITKVSVSSTPVQLCPYDPARVYTAIHNFSGNQLVIGWDTTITGTTGPIAINSPGFFEYYWERHAVLCTVPLYGAISAAPSPIYVVQVFWRPTP